MMGPYKDSHEPRKSVESEVLATETIELRRDDPREIIEAAGNRLKEKVRSEVESRGLDGKVTYFYEYSIDNSRHHCSYIKIIMISIGIEYKKKEKYEIS